ncbi:Adenylyl cyclase-associated protein 1 [Atta colombica]|uniref:Adenylyl cyclase-associated protein 1 n=1 Tax=Atta colombica TaxID=520822 RepID=A0A195B255_9HYME|nr:Adenylyl cyclase-associated protein 1 [Atta colombica]
MFKCCVCNSASKANTEREDDTPVGSPKLTTASVEVDDEIKFATRVDKLNGDVQKSPENISLENKDVSLEDKVISLENKDALPEDKDASPEDKDASPESKDASLEDKDVSLENKDVSLEDKDTSPEDKSTSPEDKDALPENKNASLEDKNSPLENKDASLEDKNISPEDKDVSLEDKDATLKDKDTSLEVKDLLEAKNASLNSTPIRVNSLNSTPIRVYSNGNTDIEESSSSSSTKETVEEAGEESVYKIVDDKDNSNLDGVAEDWTQPIENVDSIGTVASVKTNLYDASGYIERTIDDGPEDEGDDSVFEGYPSENEIKKAPPVSSIPRWLSEEDDGEYVSGGCSGMQEPPATPVARDELALRRHRFFSDLLQAAQNSTEHRVRFDPLGPMVHTGRESTDKEEHLEELVNRLENVTRRLENVHFAVQTQDTAVQTSTPSPRRSTSSGSSLSLSSKQETVPNPPTKMSIAGYEDFLAGPVKEYLQLSQKIGGDVDVHSKLVEKAFQIQLQFIHMAASRPAPMNQSEQVSLFAPMSAQIQQIQEFREKNRGSPFFNHLSAISESIPALGWVAVSPTPAPYVKEMNDAGQFYTNRVLKDWKEKDKIHIDWCKAWVQTLTDLQQYVRQHHTTGLVWGKTGTPAGVCLPPPPPPSMPIGDIAPTLNDDRSALFAQINQGEDITKSLKKVTSDMQTHKNPALRSGPAPFKAPINAIPMKTVLSASAPIDKPPVFTRDGKKWLVDNVEMNNVVYMFRCQDSTLTVKGKVNSVVMDSCRKSSVVFDSLVSSIEFVNCQSVQMQVLGKVPTISIDKTDGCQMYLSTDSLGVELITSKSSEMNVMVPKANGDYSEYPVPEQFKTTISKNGLNTMAVDSLG